MSRKHEIRVVVDWNPEDRENPALYKVNKMKFADKGDKSAIIYNEYITLENIPLEAYEYIVNGKPAIEWVMHNYQIKRHKESGIVNDPNDWARESGHPDYILMVLLNVIDISLKTMEIVKSLPEDVKYAEV